MDFVFGLIDRVTGPDTELVELLPIVVLLAVVAGQWYQRSLILHLIGLIGELRAELGLRRLVEEMARERAEREKGGGA